MTGDLVRLESAWRVYPRGQVVGLRDVTFSVRRGSYTAITGPSGSGKSTLLHLAGGLDHPTRGRVLFDGSEPSSPTVWTRLRARRIGVVFQAFHLLGGLTAAENVEVPMFGVTRSDRARRHRAAALLEAVGLSHRRAQRAADLSAGECQRVAIARSLANAPDLILADEPTGNLDSRTAGEILDLLEELHRRERIALLLVTHDLQVSRRADRVVGLLDGRIVSEERTGSVE